LPVVWQGWAILVAFGGLVGAGLFIFPLSTKMGSLLIYWALLTAALMAICWLKGEPPRWRWGDDEGAR
jgi:hypothetical protein